MSKRVGKACAVHPELGGLRYSPSGACVRCHIDASDRTNKTSAGAIERSLRARRLNARIKAEVIGHYGGACRVCGEADIDVLTLDHVVGGGSDHRRAIGNGRRESGGQKTYRWAKRHGYPDIFRVLCYNCNVKAYRVAMWA